MSKLLLHAQKSKLSKQAEELTNNEKITESVIRKIKASDFPRSYRFDSSTIEILKETSNRINDLTPKKISESKLLKALICLSKNISDEDLIKALKSTW